MTLKDISTAPPKPSFAVTLILSIPLDLGVIVSSLPETLKVITEVSEFTAQ